MTTTSPESMFHSPRGLYPFQAEHVVHCVLRRNNILCWDTGLGKTIGALATAALLYEDKAIDHVLIVCEQAKIAEWVEDVERFTKFRAIAYTGLPTRRERIRSGTVGRRKKGQEPDPLHTVIIGSFETLREDLVRKRAVDSRSLEEGPLLTTLGDKRMLVIYDETARLANRTSLTHRAHRYAVDHWRENAGCRVMALTATPMERNPLSYFSLGLIVCPETMPTVKAFEKEYVAGYNFVGDPNKFKNLDDLAIRFKHVLLRKRKTDEDVRAQFPTMNEEFRFIKLGDKHRAFYDQLHEAIQSLDDPVLEQAAFNTLRQLVGHPLALVHSEGAVAQTVMKALGVKGLEALGCAKRDRLISDLTAITNAGDRAIVFSYFPSIIDPMMEDLKAAGIRAVRYHGKLSAAQREEAKRKFKAGEADVFFASASGERGINLPEASVVINYDLPSKHAAYIQRLNRASRIGSNAGGIVVAKSYIVEDSVEEGIANLWLGRNQQTDTLVDFDLPEDDDSFITADTRRRILRMARKDAAA